MKRLTRYLYYPLDWLLHGMALFPLKLLYGFSDILYGIAYYGVRYRRGVVRRNLTNAFPEKSQSERRSIEKGFYRFFCDYMMETIKLLSISDSQMRCRMHITNPELADRYLLQDKVVLLLLGHYGNWEWVPSLMLWSSKEVRKRGVQMGQIYRPLKNSWFDAFFLRLRSRFGSYGISKQDTLREMIRLKGRNKPAMVGFMADQTPSRANIHHWVSFLHQDTPVYTGAERIGRKIGAVVLYLDVTVMGRGKYEATYRLISENAKEDPEFAITDQYIRLFEETVRRNPAYWLWSHKRWKYKPTPQA